MTTLDRAVVVLNGFLNSNTLFTILDISDKVKVDGAGFVTHTEVRQAVKSFLDTIIVGRGWDITTIDVITAKGDTVEANLYHPNNVNPDTYTNRDRRPNAPVAVPVVGAVCPGVCATTPATPVASGVPAHVQRAHVHRVVKPRQDGAIEISKVTLVESQLTGEVVDVVNHPNSISLVKGNDRVVGNHGFRITSATLAKSGLAGKDLYVYSYSDKVVVSEKV